MLYTHRLHIKDEPPIGFTSIEVLKGLMEVYKDKVVYIEDLEMKPFMDLCIQALQQGYLLGTDGAFFSYIEGEYYIDKPDIYREPLAVHELTVRTYLQTFYKRNKDAYLEDKAYLEGLPSL